MPTLLDLLALYPALESLIVSLSFADLLHLARTNSNYRAALHGFQIKEDGSPSYPVHPIKKPRHLNELHHMNGDGRTVRDGHNRTALNLGQHQTGLWQHLKSISQMQCHEARHTKGKGPKGCRMCSMPICEACVVKSSFAKGSSTYPTRYRQLCTTCWAANNHLMEQLRHGPDASRSRYLKESQMCMCAAKDGILCSECKENQLSDVQAKLAHCAGYQCHQALNENNSAGRICLWCLSILPGPRSQAEYWHIYDRKYAMALADERASFGCNSSDSDDSDASHRDESSLSPREWSYSILPIEPMRVVPYEDQRIPIAVPINATS